MIVKDFTLTLDNNLSPRPPGLDTLQAAMTVEGTMTVTFNEPAWALYWRAYEGAVRNKALRMARPHMPKRMFQRLRGRMRAQRTYR